MRGTSWWLILIVIVMGAAVGIVGGTYLAYHGMSVPKISIGNILNPFEGERYVRILMLGEDNTAKGRKNGHGLSDTLVVMAIDTQTKEVRAISIPRDTQVEIPGHGTCKINSANVYGGPECAKQVISDLLGVPIQYYVATNTSGLRGLVDMAGGVYVIIDENMNYVDRHGGLYIHFRASKEKQLLNGEQAEEYVRFRHDRVGDSGFRMKDGKRVPAGRTVRQQKFMRALANRIMSLQRNERAEFLSRAVEKGYLESNLDMSQWKELAEFLVGVDPDKMVMSVLPGSPGNEHGASYWIVDTEQLPTVVQQNMLFEPLPTQTTNTPEKQPEVPANVEVLNGSGIRGAARKVADKLRTEGLEIKHMGNAPSSDYVDCCIITRKGKISQVDKISKLLGCSDIREESASPGKPDITVIIGSNYGSQL